MTKAALIENIVLQLKSIGDKDLLVCLNQLLTNYSDQDSLSTWSKLTKEQKDKILNSYNESKNIENLKSLDTVLRKL